MRDYKVEFEQRVAYIRDLVESSHSKGIVFGNSGGKDSALVGILCKAACDNTVGIIMPCASKRRVIDLTEVRQKELDQLATITEMTDLAIANIAPRLRMTTLYAVAAAEGRMVAGTGNASEAYMGYFTKWGDGAHDFNPISDLTATEVFEFLEYLNAPRCIIDKAPSAGLFDGQTDEQEMGVTYAAIDRYLMTGEAEERDREIIERFHARSEHKRHPISTFANSKESGK